jgi:Domain of unknown function (DUF4262)
MEAQKLGWMDQREAWITDTIRRCGWAISYIGGGTCSRPGCTCEGDEGPPFGYTIGLFGLGHPELLVFSLDASNTAAVLNDLGSRVRGGEHLMPGMELEFEHWPHKVVTEPVPNAGEIVLEANFFYERPAEYSVPVLQLTYADPHGRFPWDDGFTDPGSEPRPGTFRA